MAIRITIPLASQYDDSYSNSYYHTNTIAKQTPRFIIFLKSNSSTYDDSPRYRVKTMYTAEESFDNRRHLEPVQLHNDSMHNNTLYSRQWVEKREADGLISVNCREFDSANHNSVSKISQVGNYIFRYQGAHYPEFCNEVYKTYNINLMNRMQAQPEISQPTAVQNPFPQVEFQPKQTTDSSIKEIPTSQNQEPPQQVQNHASFGQLAFSPKYWFKVITS